MHCMIKRHNFSHTFWYINLKCVSYQVNCEDNPSNCVNDNISKVLEVYDEETCLETMRGDQEK